MRVAVNVEQLLYRSPGGIGRYTAQLVSLLPRLFPDDEVLPFAARHRRARIEAALANGGATAAGRAGVTVLPLPRPVLYESWVRFGQPPLQWGARRLARTDVVHAPSLAVPPRGRVPLVVTVHDLAAQRHPQAFSPRGRRFHDRGLRAAISRAELVLTVSQASADEIAAHAPLTAGRIRVVLNGVAAPNMTASERDRVLRAHQLSGVPYVLWVGSLEPRKGVTTLVAAMAELRRRGLGGPAGEARLVMGGYPGWLTADLIDAEDRAVLGDRLRQLGRLAEPELWALYAGATVFAFPSRHEGFGMPVLEAMAAGTAVACSDLPVLREVSAGAAKLLPEGDRDSWADGLEELLNDEGERERLISLGLRRSAELSAEACVRGVHDVYAEAAGW